jgi:cell division protein FtsB
VTSRSTARALQRREGHPARPTLRVVDPNEQTSIKPARVGTIAAIVFLAALFALAGFQTVLINSQSRLDDLNARVSAEVERHEQLQLELSERRSPDRITSTARERLGMITPESITFLHSVPSDHDDAGVATRSVAGDQDTGSASGAGEP